MYIHCKWILSNVCIYIGNDTLRNELNNLDRKKKEQKKNFFRELGNTLKKKAKDLVPDLNNIGKRVPDLNNIGLMISCNDITNTSDYNEITIKNIEDF